MLETSTTVAHLVTSWKVSKSLRAEGIVFNTVFTWVTSSHQRDPLLVVTEVMSRYSDLYKSKVNTAYHAYLADELIQLLPQDIDISRNQSKTWSCRVGEITTYAETLSDVLALALIKIKGAENAEDQIPRPSS